MFKRFLQLVCGLAAVAALTVSAAASSADAPTARTAGNGSGDHVPPQSYWGNNWSGNDSQGRYWRGWGDGQGDFNGGSFDNSNDAFHPGKVDHVLVSVDRVRGSHCQHLGSSGHLGRLGSCSRSPHWLRATGTQTWNYHISKKLPAGRYRLHRRAVDAAGNRERPRVRNLRIRR
jgi:hypothetical protein